MFTLSWLFIIGIVIGILICFYSSKKRVWVIAFGILGLSLYLWCQSYDFDLLNISFSSCLVGESLLLAMILILVRMCFESLEPKSFLAITLERDTEDLYQ